MTDVPRPGAIVRRELAGAAAERLVERLTEELARVGSVVFAYVFGSFAQGRPFEDVDVAVFLDRVGAPNVDALSVQLELMGRLEATAGAPVDVVVLNDAPVGLRKAALRGRVLFSKDEALRLQFVENTGLQAMDMAYLARESLQELLQP